MTIASTSSRKWVMIDVIGDTADGPNGQIVVMAITPHGNADEETYLAFEGFCRSIQVNRRALPK